MAAFLFFNGHRHQSYRVTGPLLDVARHIFVDGRPAIGHHGVPVLVGEAYPAHA